jgi:hypothetical protein
VTVLATATVLAIAGTAWAAIVLAILAKLFLELNI